MSESRVPVIEGEVIPSSRGVAAFEIVFGLVLALGGLGVFFVDYTKAGGALMFGGVGVALLGLMNIFSTRRIVIGDEAVQELKGQGVVTLHVTYENIAALEHVKQLEEGAWFVGINLADPKDPSCFCDSGFGSLKDRHGFDVVFTHHFTSDPTKLHRKLRLRLEEFKRRTRE